MEIFNNIWTALSTPNEGLVNIILIICSIFETIIVMYLFIYILNIKASKRQKIIYIILSVLEGAITNNLLPSPINNIVNFIILFIIIYFVFKQSILRTLLAVFLPIIIFALISTLILNPFIKLNHIDYNLTETVPIYRLECLFIIYCSATLVLLLIKNKNIYLNILDEFDKKTKLTLIFTLILAIFVLCIQLFIAAFYTNELPVIVIEILVEFKDASIVRTPSTKDLLSIV